MKKSLLCFVLMLLVACTFALTGCSVDATKTDLEKIQEQKIINIGITIYEPMDYFGEDGETIVGFDADLANEFAASIGCRARFVTIKWGEKVLELNGGYIDLIWNGMTATDELAKNIDLSIAYATNYQCVVVQKNAENEYVNADSLKGKTVAVESGSAGDTEASKFVDPVRVNSQLDALNEVKAGTSAAAVLDYTMAYSLVGKNDYQDLVIIDANKISFEQEVFAIGARKGSDLTAKLNEFLMNKYKDGSLETLAKNYSVGLNEDAFKQTK